MRCHAAILMLVSALAWSFHAAAPTDRPPTSSPTIAPPVIAPVEAATDAPEAQQCEHAPADAEANLLIPRRMRLMIDHSRVALA